jgi:hypothetical protein
MTINLPTERFKSPDRISHLAAAAIVAGTPIELAAGMIGIPPNDIANADTDELDITGRFRAWGKAANAWVIGEQIGWDADGDPLNGTAGDGCYTNVEADWDFPVGSCVETKASGDEMGIILLNVFLEGSAPYIPAAAQQAISDAGAASVDIYLPHHVSAHATALADHEWSHPLQVYSTYGIEPGDPLRIEQAAGRFHGSLAIRTDLIDRIGGWIDTRRADFDQQQISMCQDLAGDPGRPDHSLPPSYIFRWGDTGASHCQGLMTSPSNEDWYERNTREGLPEIGQVRPRFDTSTETVVGLSARS